jgi:plastocyanin domain-containing protein
MKLALAALLLGSLGHDVSGCGSGKRTPPPAVTAADGTVTLTVTESGFEPTPVKVKAGQPLTLVVTRKTDATCATEIVVKDYGIHEKLPLGTPVTIRFTPEKTGELKYGCAMDQMVSGVLLVE